MKEYKGYISVDFDATLASYIRPFKFDHLGKPQKDVIKAINYFYNEGYHINIFTGRVCTPKMKKWLIDNNVKYHAFNCQPLHHDCASNKPYWDLILDDKAVNVHWKYNKKSYSELIKEMKKVIKWSKDGKNK